MIHLKKRLLIFLLSTLFIGTIATENCNAQVLLAGGKLVTKGAISEIPITFQEQFILIKARINNSAKEYTFLLDTGCSSVVISKRVAAELKIGKWSPRILLTDAGKKHKLAPLTRLKSLRVGAVEVRRCAAIVHNLDSFEFNGTKVDGLLGNTFLKFLKVKIDYPNKLLTLSSQRDDDGNMPATSGYTSKLFWDYYGLIHTKIKIGSSGSVVSAIIDTGANNGLYLNIPYKMLKKVQPELNCKLFNSIGAGAIGALGQLKTSISRLSRLEVGGFSVDNIPVGFYKFPKVGISNKFLSHFVVTIDFPRMEMLLVPNPQKTFATNISDIGIKIKRDEHGTVRIIGVWEGSQAEQMGLKVGDEITNFKIDQKEVSFDEMKRLMHDDQYNTSTFSIQVVNDGMEREVLLKKTNLLPEVTEP